MAMLVASAVSALWEVAGMSRAMKFRAWHTKLNKMFSAEEMGADQLTLLPDGRGFINVSSTSTRLSTLAGDLMIPLQFTGLLDRQGREIYDGDWIRFVGTQDVARVFERLGCWYVENRQELGYFDPSTIEIIGNIYEHPHLVKES